MSDSIFRHYDVMIVVKIFQKLSLHGFHIGYIQHKLGCPPLPVMANDGLERNPSGSYYREGGCSPRYKPIETGFPHHFLRQSDVGLQPKTLQAVWQENSRLGRSTWGSWRSDHFLKNQRNSILVKEEGLMNIAMNPIHAIVDGSLNMIWL